MDCQGDIRIETCWGGVEKGDDQMPLTGGIETVDQIAGVSLCPPRQVEWE
jgi:hypothetical protein